MATVTESLSTLSPPITVKQWGELPEKAGCELVNGRLVEKPLVAIWHEKLNIDLITRLTNYVTPRELGFFLGGNARVKISDLTGREPDIFFIPKHLYSQIGKNYFFGIPSLVIETLSPSNEQTDREDKYDEYAQLGIPEYWIVDFPNRCLEVHRLKTRPDGSRAYELAETHRHDAVFQPALFPGLDIPLAEIWPTEFENRTDN